MIAGAPPKPIAPVGRLPFAFAKRHGVLVRGVVDGKAQIVYREGAQPSSVAELRRFLGIPLIIERVAETAFDELLRKAYEGGSGEAGQIVEGIEGETDLAGLAEGLPEPSDLMESEDDAPVIRLINAVLTQAIKENASDIHIEPYENRLVIRFRVDGVLREVLQTKRAVAPLLISRVKVMSRLDIAEKRLPQDGRIGLSIDGHYVDLRVATLPVVRGEGVVMRILDKTQVVIELDRLGMEEPGRTRFLKAIGAANGAVLVTGPTGSGKTTTLYAAMNEVNSPDKTLITVEDPVEYELDGVKQVQVHQKSGLTFASGLRALVRADPDVIMVGEVRDAETAGLAVEAALTGHLVLTTLHTNDAPLAPARLIDMGIEPFLVAAGIECVVAQRLVRRLCDCKQPVKLSKLVLAENGFAVERGFGGFEPGSCVRCGQTGYRGRIGLYEVMPMSDELRSLILEKRPAEELRAAAQTEGMRTLRADGLEKIRTGITSVAEVLRVVGLV
jgi:general secretion pathway protein E